jgi:tight adherence protein B
MSRDRPAVEEVADVAQRMAVLLAAGVPPAAAWGYLAEPSDPSAAGEVDPLVDTDADAAHDGLDEPRAREKPASAGPGRGRAVGRATAAVISAAALAASRGADVPRAIAHASDAAARRRAHGLRRPRDGTDVREAWRGLAVAVDVATGSGAPLAGALRDLASALRDLGQTQRDRESALAGPRTSARMVLALPAVGILFGVLLGFDTLHVLFATPAGLACLGVGGGLLLAARGWNRALLRRAAPRERMPGLAIELVAVAMAGGGSAPGALRRVTDACGRFGLDAPDPAATASVLFLAQRAGVGTAELLRAEAEQSRRDARSAAQAASASLGVRLMAPLAVCVLPAFMLLSVAPLVMSILSSTFRGI